MNIGNMDPVDKHVIDAASVLAVMGGLVTEHMPLIALFLSVIWTLIRIYETKTVQKLLGKEKEEESADE